MSQIGSVIRKQAKVNNLHALVATRLRSIIVGGSGGNIKQTGSSVAQRGMFLEPWILHKIEYIMYVGR